MMTPASIPPAEVARLFLFKTKPKPNKSSKLHHTLIGKSGWGQERVSPSVKRAPLCSYLSEEV